MRNATEAIVLLGRWSSGQLYVRYANARFIELARTIGIDAFDPQGFFATLSDADQEEASAALEWAFTESESSCVTVRTDAPRGARWLRISLHPWPADEMQNVLVVFDDVTKLEERGGMADVLAGAVEQAQNGVCILELPDGDPFRRYVVYANDAICELMQLPRERILSEGIAQCVFTENPELLQLCIDQVSRGSRFEHDVRARRGDGTPVWVHMTITPFYGKSGRVEKWVAVYRNVDDRKRMDDQLTLFHSILSETSDFIVVADATPPVKGGPVVTYANAAFAALVGLDVDRVVGKGLLSFLSPRNDAQVVANVVSRLEQHRSISHELLLRRLNDGNDLWIELTGHPVHGEGVRFGAWFFIGKDISVRKQAYTQTAQLMTALDLAEEPIAIYGVISPLELELQHMNERATTLECSLLEGLLRDPSQRVRVASAWPVLENGKSVHRLVRGGCGNGRRWATLELRPMNERSEPLGSIIAIEHGLRMPLNEGFAGVGLAIALGHEILRYAELHERRDAFLEVLREEWDANGTFSRTDRGTDVALRVKERNGYVVMPRGVLFDHAVAVDFAWPGVMPPRRLTALRIFLETLARAD